MNNYYGSVYPGGGRMSTFDMSIPSTLVQQETSQTDAVVTTPVSNLSQANIWMSMVVMVFILWLFNFV